MSMLTRLHKLSGALRKVLDNGKCTAALTDLTMLELEEKTWFDSFYFYYNYFIFFFVKYI